MSTTETETTPHTTTSTCPACGSHVLSTVTLDYGVAGGYRPDHFGVEPEQGDTITRCDDCGEFFVHGDGTDRPAPVVDEDDQELEQPGAIAQLEEFFTGKLQQLGDAMGAKVAYLENQLAAANAAREEAEEKATAFAAAQPAAPPAGGGDATDPAASSAPPAAADDGPPAPAPVPDPPAS